MKKLFTALIFLQSLFVFAQEFPIATGSYSQTYPSMVFTNDLYFTTFLDKRSGSYNYGFHGKFVEPDGTVLPDDIEIVSPISFLSFMHEIIYGESGYLFVWSRGVSVYDRDAYGLLVDDDGEPHGNIFPLSIGNSESASFVEAAFDGENFLVIWQEGLPNSGSVIRAQFVNQEGQLVGSNFSIRPESLSSQVSQIYPDIEFNGENYFVVWDDNRNGNRDIYGQFVSLSGELLGDDIPITTNSTDQLLVQLAFGGQHFYAVWADERLSSNDKSIYGQFIALDGNLVGENLVISPQTNSEGRSWPDVAASNGEFLVTWDQEWLEYDNPLDSRNFVDKKKYEAAGVEMSRPTIWYDIYARKISFQGTYASDEMAICTADYHQQDSDVISDGSDFLVSWSDSRNGNQYYNIYGYIVEGSEITLPPVLTPDEINFTSAGQFLDGEEFSIENPNNFEVLIDSIYFKSAPERFWYLNDPVSFPFSVQPDSAVSMDVSMLLPARNNLPKSFVSDTMVVQTMDMELELLLNIDEVLLDSVFTIKMDYLPDSLYFQTVEQAIGGLTFGMINRHYPGIYISSVDVTGSYGYWDVIPEEELPFTIYFKDTLHFQVMSMLPVQPDFVPDEIGVDTLWFNSWDPEIYSFPIYYDTEVIDSIWTKVPERLQHTNFLIHPNPAGEYVSVEISKNCKPDRIEIIEIHGNTCKSINGKELNDGSRINLSGIENGVYLVRVLTGREVFFQKLIVRK